MAEEQQRIDSLAEGLRLLTMATQLEGQYQRMWMGHWVLRLLRVVLADPWADDARTKERKSRDLRRLADELERGPASAPTHASEEANRG